MTAENGHREAVHENGHISPDFEPSSKKPYWQITAFISLISTDLFVSLFLMTPLFTQIIRGTTNNHYTLHGTLSDLGMLAFLRALTSLLAMAISYSNSEERPEYPFESVHPNGERKTREELEEEALEEAFGSWLWRFTRRPSFATESVAIFTQGLCVIKALLRMNIEIGFYHDKQPMHPLIWVAIMFTAFTSLIEACVLDCVCQVVARYAKENEPQGILRSLSSLSVPLLTDTRHSDDFEELEDNEEERNEGEERGTSDITSDANYKASWKDLLRTCSPDVHLLALAFVFLILAAISQTLIPLFLGHILDALTEAFSNHNENDDESVLEVPGFVKNIELLVLVSICAGVFSGLRGSIFTVVGGRVNCRLRIKLMDSLLVQDIGFFDVTKTGDITSRLSSDTTLVGDQVTMNVNIFLRSLVQALGVLGFMFTVSWQLSIVAFVSVPVITMLSRWYGGYVRSLTKLMQKRLAEGNVVSESVLSSMPTVRSFDAATSALREFEMCMDKYLTLNLRSSFAYCGFACLTTSLPELVFAVVVFYGGLMVRNEDITSGQLVSFLLYLQSLSDAIASIGWVFGSLTQAVGAADKVFELLNRQPRMTPPSTTTRLIEPERNTWAHNLQLGTFRTTRQRLQGIVPEVVRGEIEFKDVTLYYPSRPQRRVLNGISFKVKPGSIVALVGESGGGKSSVISLLLHHYEHQSGRILFDGVDMHELQSAWLCQNVSIVSQEPTLFGRSIKRNIIYGLEGSALEPTQEEIEDAARLANADSFIQSMPQKYDTEVGERGVQLSGGQKQRIAIARALVRKPRVLLLDEATSALDAESEHLVQQAIDDMISRGKNSASGGEPMTVVIVAHRLSTVRSADRIFVLKDGSVVEEGSHDELLQNNETGVYASLIQRQMEAQTKLEN